MSTHSRPDGAGSPVPETEKGALLAGSAPFGTNETSHSNCAQRAKESKHRTRFANQSRSTSTKAQRERILAILRTGKKSTFDFRRAGIMQTSTRIFELRARGHNIVTARRDLFDADGYRHERVAVYTLVSEPDGSGDDIASIPAGVRERKRRDALLQSLGTSGRQGGKRTNEGKRNAVLTMLGDAEWSKLGDREIARHCTVSHTFVANLRKAVPPPVAPPAPKPPTPPAGGNIAGEPSGSAAPTPETAADGGAK